MFPRLAEPRIYFHVRRLILVVLALWIPLALFSGFRAIVQVYSLDVVATPGSAGTDITVRVTTSGRTHVDLVVEALQDGQALTLARTVVRSNRTASVDPRPRRETLRLQLPIAKARGPVTLRATATGRSQWLRTPPPAVREVRLVTP